MTPIAFTEANCHFAPPPDLTEEQCRTIPAFQHNILGGSCDGLRQVVVAYKLTAEEIAALQAGAPLYLSMIGGLVPHYLSFDFFNASHPA